MIGVLALAAGCVRKPPEHGVEFIVELTIDPTNSAAARQSIYEQTSESLGRRLEEFRQFNPFFWGEDSNQIRIQLATLSPADEARVRNQLTNSTSLEFRLVHEKSDDLVKHGE